MPSGYYSQNYNVLFEENIILTNEIYRLRHVNETQTNEILRKLRQINEDQESYTETDDELG
jgi:hypothetical protein